jgi:LmbE family N-acetylglucosaminyl deacetylase
MTNVLMILSHADDELLFGWPVLFHENFQCELLICSSDENNPERAWCKRRKEALAEVCELLRVPFKCLPYPSEFFRLGNRPRGDVLGPIHQVQLDVQHALECTPAEVIFTHNPHGEYGHTDHRMIHKVVTEFTTKPVLVTDLYEWANWPLGPKSSTLSPRHGYTPENLRFGRKMHHADLVLYDKCEKIYHKHGCWTWSRPVQQEARVYQL